MIDLLNSFTLKFITASNLKRGACVHTNKRLWYNDKVAFTCISGLPLPCVNELRWGRSYVVYQYLFVWGV